jgi:uncharacterized repeat protein (TIGR04076 family)
MIDPEIVSYVESMCEGMAECEWKKAVLTVLAAAKKGAEMEEWIEDYGQHLPQCAVSTRPVSFTYEPWPDCTCGLSKLLEDK